ncbi:MAG: hypothetical protein AAFO94_17005, partial [Bacteroidota bacterium]
MRLIFLALVFLSVSACWWQKPTTPYEYALLCAHVYDDASAAELPKHLQPFLTFDESQHRSRINWEADRMHELREEEAWGQLLLHVAGKVVSRGGYFGRAYLNERNGQLIIAHRGTDLDLNSPSGGLTELSLNETSLFDLIRDIDDDYDIYRGRIPKQQFESAKHFTKVVETAYREQYQKEPTIIHTGHSLGAVLAELSAIEATGKAITFESPGTKPMLAELGFSTSEKTTAFDITCYNAAPNQINSLHEHVGTVIPLQAEATPLRQSDEIDAEGLRQHSIKILQQIF